MNRPAFLRNTRSTSMFPLTIMSPARAAAAPAAAGSATGQRAAAGLRHRPAAQVAMLLALAAGLATSLDARAGTPGVDEPPLPGTPRPLSVPQFDEQRLPNGVRVVLAPRSGLPLATVALHLRLGAAADPDGKAGLANLTTSLRTKGAVHQGKRLDATQLARQAEALGGTLEAGASWSGSTLSMTVATSKLAQATALVADTVLHPTLDATELQRLREQTADSLKFSLTDPMALAGLAARRAAWGQSVYGGALTAASLGRITRDDVLAFHRRQLRPELATLVISGDVSREQALALAQRTLGAWKGNRMALPEPRDEPASSRTPATVLIDLPGAGQSGVIVMAPSVAADSPERRVAQVAAAVLGGGYSARLNTEVRIKRGLSYGAFAGNELQPVGGFMTASTQTNNPTAAQAVQVTQGEIIRLGQEAPTADELAARQATLVGNFGRQIETTAGLASAAINQIALGRPLDEVQQFAPQVLAVTPEQVRAFAARHWTTARLRTVVVGDLGKAGDSLKALDDKALVLRAAQLDLESAGLVK